MAADVWAWCENTRAFGRTVTVKVKFADFRQVTISRSFSTVIAQHSLRRQAAVELVRTLPPTAKGVRLLGVTVSNFDQAPIDAAGELPLFDAAVPIMPHPDAYLWRHYDWRVLMVHRAGSAVVAAARWPAVATGWTFACPGWASVITEAIVRVIRGRVAAAHPLPDVSRSAQ